MLLPAPASVAPPTPPLGHSPSSWSGLEPAAAAAAVAVWCGVVFGAVVANVTPYASSRAHSRSRDAQSAGDGG